MERKLLHIKILKKCAFRYIDPFLWSNFTRSISQKKMILQLFASQNQKSFLIIIKKKLIKDIQYFKRFTKFSDLKILKLLKENQKNF